MNNTIRIACLLTSLVTLTAYGQNEWRDKWREMNYATVNGVEIAYDDVGTGETILLIHGGTVADSFVPILDEPALSRYRLINMHRRGNGQSGDYEGSNDYQRTTADALALLSHLGVSKVHVVAHSAGGQPALYLAMTASDVVQSLVVVEPNVPYIEGMDLENPERPAREAERQRLAPLIQADPYFGADQWLDMMLGPDWRTILSSVYLHAPDHLARVYAAGRQPIRPRVAESDYENIQAPVLWVWSEQREPRLERLSAFLREQIPTMEYTTAGETHMLQVLYPEPLAIVIADFVEQYPIQ